MIYVVEYPKAKTPERRKPADVATATMPCPKCGETMRPNVDDEVKTMSPPLYHFRCSCGFTGWRHHQDEGGRTYDYLMVPRVGLPPGSMFSLSL